MFFLFVSATSGTNSIAYDVLPETCLLSSKSRSTLRLHSGNFKVYKVIKKRKFDTILATLNGEMYMIVSRNRQLTNCLRRDNIYNLEVKDLHLPGEMNAREHSEEGRYSWILEKRYKKRIVEVYTLIKVNSNSADPI